MRGRCVQAARVIICTRYVQGGYMRVGDAVSVRRTCRPGRQAGSSQHVQSSVHFDARFRNGDILCLLRCLPTRLVCLSPQHATRAPQRSPPHLPLPAAGMSSGFGADDSYTAYDKPLFADRGSSLYRPRAEADEAGEAARSFKPDKGFAGARGGRLCAACVWVYELCCDCPGAVDVEVYRVVWHRLNGWIRPYTRGSVFLPQLPCM